MAQVAMDCIPSELAKRNQWITWRVVEGQKRPNGRWQDPKNWCEFSEVSHFERTGFVFTDADNLCGIDLDGCIRADGTYTEWSQEILQRFHGVAYAEVSPSGTGIKLWTQGRKAIGSKCLHQFKVGGGKQQIECYDQDRWFAVTGKLVEGFERIADGQEAIDWLCEKYLVPQKQAESKTGARKTSVVRKVASSGLMNRAEAYIEVCERPSEGARNSTAFRLAGHLFAMVEHDGERLSQSDVLELVRKWNDTLIDPLNDREIEQVVASAEKNGTPRATKPSEINRFIDDETNVSNIVGQAESVTQSATPEKRHAADQLYQVPGFITDVMELTMTSAPYPNRRLAFAGAISLLAMLTGRRVTFQNLGLNLYILGLASSGSGKDAPRKVNDEILQQCGILGSIGDSIASGSGLEDAVFQSPQLLLQVDEFDGLVRAMADEREQRFASTMVNLLRFYTASNSRYHRRMKSGEEQRSVLRPALNLFATCTPASFFESVNNRLLRNGLMARILVIDAGKRGTGQRPKPIEVDESLRMQVDFWKQCGIDPDQNLTSVNPICKEIEAGSGVLEVLDDLRSQADRHYAAREAKRDEAGMAIWARAYEIAIKLAGLYACSADCENPIVQVEATRWASEFVLHHVAEMLKLVESEVVETPFDRLCQRILKRLGRGPVGHSVLLRYAGVDTRDFNQAMETLYQRDQVLATEQESPGRKAKRIYFLADQSSESSVKFGTSSELCK